MEIKNSLSDKQILFHLLDMLKTIYHYLKIVKYKMNKLNAHIRVKGEGCMLNDQNYFDNLDTLILFQNLHRFHCRHPF